MSLFAAIVDPQTDQYSRESLFRAAAFLTWEGRIGHDAMRQLLAGVHAARSIPDGDMGWMGWATAIAMLGYSDLAPLVRQGFAGGQVDETMIAPAEFERLLGEAEAAPNDIERFTAERLGYIEDVLEALEWVSRINAFADKVLDGADPAESFADLLRPQTPVVNEWRHVGRNDPCPCGSGKKAKKCCL